MLEPQPERVRPGGVIMLKTLMAAILGCAALVAQPAREAEFARAHHSLALAGGARTVKDLKFQVGHLAIDLAEGVAQPLAAGGQTVGLHFRGRGTAVYTSAAPLEASTLVLNLEKGSKLKASPSPGGLKVVFDLTELNLVTSGMALPALTGDPAQGLEESYRWFREPFELRAQPGLGALVALQRANDATKPVVWMDFKANFDLWRYVYDESWDLRERLLLLKPATLQQRKYVNPITISEQPLGWSLAEPIADPFLLEHVELDLQAEKDDRVRYTATETLRIQQGGLRALAFDLLDIVDPMGLQRGPRQVKLVSVTDAAGASLEFLHRDDLLVVLFPKPLAEGSIQKLTFRVEGDFLLHPNGNSYWELGLEPWFPVSSALLSNRFTVHGTVKVAKPWRPITPGKTIRSSEEGAYHLSEFALENPVQFFAIFGGNYIPYEETRNGLKLRVYVYAQEARTSQKRLANSAFGILDYYRAILGEFPFKEFNIIQMVDRDYGQAPPSMVMLPDEAFNIKFAQETSTNKFDDASAVISTGDPSLVQANRINHRFAHEIAHQYWGALVQMPSWEEQWISESFAEFCAALSIRMMKGQGQGAFEAIANKWKSESVDHAKTATIPMANRVNFHENPQTTSRIRTSLLYSKGAHLLHTLYKEVGEESFVRLLKSLVASRKWQCTSSAEVAALLKLLKNKDYTPFFQENFWGTGLPK